MKLNLGCGQKMIAGFTNVDISAQSGADVIHNLNIFPYPFTADAVEEVVMDNVLEHLDDVIKVLEEIYRLCRPDALVKISVPYFKSNSAYTDPTHRHFFSETSFKYFAPDHPLHFYTTAKFQVVKTVLLSKNEPPDAKHFFRNLLPGKPILNYFLFNIYDEIYFELRCLK